MKQIKHDKLIIKQTNQTEMEQIKQPLDFLFSKILVPSFHM